MVVLKKLIIKLFEYYRQIYQHIIKTNKTINMNNNDILDENKKLKNRISLLEKISERLITENINISEKLKILQKEIDDNKKNKIFEFITKTFSKYSYNRMVDYNEKHGFESFDHFLNHNKKCVDQSNDQDTDFMLTLIEKINKEYIAQCDEEDFIEWDTDTLFFNIKNQLVFMHPR